jgi:uncharacterized protein
MSTDLENMATQTDRPARAESEEPHRLPGFHIMAKPVGPICNLNCRYCFYLEKENLYPATASWSMPGDVLESYIRQYIEAQEAPTINFAWQGGEPTLLGVDYFRRIVELEKRYANGKQIENAFQTNGILLDDAWADFLATNRFLVGLSIDGPAELHDCYRVNKGEQPTFGAVLRGLDYLKKHGVEFNTLTVVHRRNSRHPLEVYRFLKDVGSTYMQFIPIVERMAKAPDPHGLVLIGPRYEAEAEVSEFSVEPLQFGKFLCEIFDEWVRRDVARFFVQIFDVALESWLGMPQSLCVFRETCGESMAIEHNGDLYSCDHYVYPETRLGNITEHPVAALVSSEQQRRFGLDKRDSLPRYCRECEVRFACNGECPKHRFSRTPDGESGLNYLCAGYKLFFKHIDSYMQFMASELRQGRAPANVMQMIRQRGQGAEPHSRPGRNDSCPCGSGKKYKKCCGAGA